MAPRPAGARELFAARDGGLSPNERRELRGNEFHPIIAKRLRVLRKGIFCAQHDSSKKRELWKAQGASVSARLWVRSMLATTRATSSSDSGGRQRMRFQASSNSNATSGSTPCHNR